MKPPQLARVYLSILAILTVFQVLLIAGAPLGRYAWGGYFDVLPTPLRISSAVSLVIYGFFAVMVSERSGLSQRLKHRWVAQYGIWVVVAYSGLGVVLNAMSHSLGERLIWTPVTIVFFYCSLMIARAKP